MTVLSQTPPNPYVGPRAFQYGETLYGRDREVMELLDLLIAERIVLLYSPSGAGKTSLIQAALIPELEQEGFQVRPVMRVSLEPPMVGQVGNSSNRYVLSLLLSLEEALPAVQQTPLAELAGMTLADYLNRRPRVADEPDTEALIFDQFEEILTVDPTDQAAKAAFFAQVGAALRNRQLWALFSMREEFLAGLDPYLRPVPTRLSTTFRLELLGERAALEAIQQPARRAGVDFTDAAARKLVDDLRRMRIQRPDGTMEEQPGPYIEPVQLQVVCYRLWENLPDGAHQIGEVDVESVGNVDSALRDYYAERVAFIAGETGVRQRAIRDWFDRQLITEQGIRGQVLQGPEASERLDNRAIWLMVNAHLVRAEKRRGATWFELAHDRLIEPVRMDNAAWREDHLSALQRQAAVWGSQGRPADLLLRGEALEEAERWADAHPDELTRSERDFLAECRNARTIRQSRRNRTLAVSATIISGIVITAFFVSLGFFFRANNEAIRAREAAAEAVLAKEKAEARAIQRANALEVAREALQTQEAYLEAQLQELASATPVIEPTAATSTPRPTGTPSSQLTPAPRPTPTITRAVAPTLSPGQEATAAVEVLQQQLAYVRATQTSLPPDDESPFLYGFFDPGGEYLMRQAGVTGWILYPTLVNEPPQNLTSLTNEGFGVLVELNWGYNPNGTLPHETLYSDFADLCEKWVSQSQGVSHWIIGHEPNKRSRRPGFGTPNEQAITPRMYAEAFRQVRAAIRSVPGHENDQIITAAVAPWNVETTYGADPKGMYDANPTGNWIEYFRDMLLALEGDVDGIALTTATHRVNLTTVDTYITSEEKRWPDLFPETGGAYFHFRAYRDFMHAIPGSMRYLPVYITKADQDSDPLTGATWFKQNLGWVQDAYAEINDWNSDPNNQKIRALLLYRWRTEIEGGDRWGISRNEGVLQDFMQALQHRYRWR